MRKIKFLISTAIICSTLIFLGCGDDNLSTDQKVDKALEIMSNEGVDAFSKYIDRYFGEEEFDELTRRSENSPQELKKKVSISDLKNEHAYSSTYKINFTVSNGSDKNIRHITFDLLALDSNENILNSDTTSTTNVFANGNKLVTGYLEMPKGTKSYQVKINEVNFD